MWILTSLLTLATLHLVNGERFAQTYADNYGVVLPWLKYWSESSFLRKLTIVFDNFERDTFDIPKHLFTDIEVTVTIVTLKHLTTSDTLKETNYQLIDPGSCVIILSSDILNTRKIMMSPFLVAFWRPENLYVIQEAKFRSSNVYDREHRRFLEWAFERLWRFRRVHRVVVSIGNKYIGFDPFKYTNHVGRYIFDKKCDWYCVKLNQKNYTFLDVSDPSTTIVPEYFKDHRQTFDLYPLKISTFRTTTMIKNGSDYTGIDANYMKEVCEKMNVTPVVIETKQNFGWKENGVFYGALGDIVYNYADMSFNQFYVKHYSTNQVDMSVAISSDKLCVVVPKAPPIPEYLVILRIFTPEACVLIFLGHFVISMIYRFMRRYCHVDAGEVFEFYGNGEEGYVVGKRDGRSKETSDEMQKIYVFRLTGKTARRSKETNRIHSKGFKGSSVSCLASLGKYLTKVLLQMVEPFELAQFWISERMLIICGLVLSLILNGVFTSQLASSFSKLSHYEDIHTLEDLEKSGLAILTSSRDVMEDALSNADSPYVNRLRTRMQYANDTEIYRRLFDAKDAGLLHRKSTMPMKFNEFQRNVLHVVEECPKVYIIAHMITKGSPFLRRINDILGRLNNGGFYHKWFDEMSVTAKEETPEELKPKTHRILTIRHFCIPFVFLSIGLATSTLVFIYERRQSA